MTSLATTCTSAFSTFTVAAQRKVAAIGAWYQARRDYRLLCQMDDSMLKDIGLSSSDLRDATTVGVFGDPTSIVAGRAAERGGWRRQSSLKGR